MRKFTFTTGTHPKARKITDHFCSRVYELLKILEQARTVYMKRLRTVTLHAEYESESVLLNLLLRNYLHYDLYEQAEKLISKSTFPEQGRPIHLHSSLHSLFSKQQRIRSIFLLPRPNQSYSTRILQRSENAHKRYFILSSCPLSPFLALRKSPQVSGVGFRQAATKLLTVVDLLLGDIPERSRFTEKAMEGALKPYFALTQAVRIGNLVQFNKGTKKTSIYFSIRFQFWKSLAKSSNPIEL